MPDDELKDTLQELLDKEHLTTTELKTILKSSHRHKADEKKLYISKKHFKYGYFSDPHIGHEKFSEPLYEQMVRHFKKEGVEFVLNIGDTLEGMSGRPGHIYELTHQGYDKQINYASNLLNEITTPIYGIDGNHDGWYYKKNNGGAIVGNDLEQRVKNYTNLGQMEGDLNIDGIKLKLFHPGDGTAYATSYKLQKLIESFGESEKPDIVHEGHYHKALYMFSRGVHGFESGTLCGQSEFMRGKKIPAHMGFGVVDVYPLHNKVNRLKHEFIPHYD